jgi:molybdopterin-containing oxidoreductase family iron-sulfur binding subunit
MPNVIAIPIGQGHGEYGRYAKDRGVNPIEILSPQLEPITGNLASSATRVSLTATGGRVKLVKTSGVSRDLGRDIVQHTGAGVEVSSAVDNSIPITEVTT